MTKTKVECQHHQDSNFYPEMIYFGENNGLGRQYICAVCSRVRVFNVGEIVTLSTTGRYGFISGQKDNFFFHFNNLVSDFIPKKGMTVSFEVSFLEDARIQAIGVEPFQGENNEH